MDNQLVSSNHSSLPNAIRPSTRVVDPVTIAHFAAADALSEAGIEEIFIAMGDSVRELGADLRS
jgi:hypothetical protein